MSGPSGGYRSNYDAVVERSETLRRENQALRAELAQLRSVLDPPRAPSGAIPRPVIYALAASIVVLGLAIALTGPRTSSRTSLGPTVGTAATSGPLP
jgi:hypothetical protein